MFFPFEDFDSKRSLSFLLGCSDVPLAGRDLFDIGPSTYSALVDGLRG